MTVLSLFQSHSFSDIERPFLHLLNVNDHQVPNAETTARWKALYEQWKAEANPKQTAYHIRLVERWEYCSPLIDMICTVRDAQNKILGPVAMHSSRDEVFAMEVVCDEDVQITTAELAAGLFYEMTFYPPKK